MKTPLILVEQIKENLRLCTNGQLELIEKLSNQLSMCDDCLDWALIPPPHKDDWKYFYDELNKEFNFNFDPCPYQHEKWDGLLINWKERNFINPPYNRKLKDAFVIKAIKESEKGKLCVMLLPVSTSTKLFHDFILPNQKEIRFVKGKFGGTKGEYVKTGMHDSMIIVFDGRKKQNCFHHL